MVYYRQCLYLLHSRAVLALRSHMTLAYLRECHQFFSPTLTIDDTIKDVAWDYIRDGYDIDVEDASAVIKHCLTQMKVI